MLKNKIHTTNYTNTFIEVAEDSKAEISKVPRPGKSDPTLAELQYNMLIGSPYTYTSDEVLFACHVQKKDILPSETSKEKEIFFSKGQPCFRCSPLTKSHGYGIHFDEHGKMALYGIESEAYEQWIANPKVQKVKAMRSSRK